VLFDHPAPLPVAKVHARSVATLASRLRGARDDGWRWLRPRAVPAVVAIVGMLAVLGATNYLTQLATHTPVQSVPAQAAVPPPVEQVAEAPPLIIVTKTEISYQGTIVVDTPVIDLQLQRHVEIDR
jgi:hypothetical protein